MGDNKKRERNKPHKKLPNSQVMRNRIVDHSFTDKQPVSKQHPRPAFPQFVSWAWCHTVWYIPLAGLDQLCPLPNPCAPPAFLLSGHETLKSLDLIYVLLSNNLKLQCVIKIILMLNPNHNTIASTRKKMNSITVKNSFFLGSDWRLVAEYAIFTLNEELLLLCLLPVLYPVLLRYTAKVRGSWVACHEGEEQFSLLV